MDYKLTEYRSYRYHVSKPLKVTMFGSIELRLVGGQNSF
jgi:hypothetical protein